MSGAATRTARSPGPDADLKHITHWIGGKPWTGGASAARATSTTRPPARSPGTVDLATAAEVNAAVAAARPPSPTGARPR